MCNIFKNFVVVSWNVRGLGNPDKCAVVKDALVASTPSVICLQETKLSDLKCFKTHSFLPPHFTNSIQYIPKQLWVPKALVTHVQGPKLVWVPKTQK